jgi:hypothetical protein
MRHRGLVLACAMAAGALVSRPAAANVFVTIDKSTQQMSVAIDGALRWQWRVSTGAPGYDTPSGTFRAFRMEASHFSKEFDDAPMPHSIFFTQRGHAIHGYLNTSHLGLPVSHGCVRLDPGNAAKLYTLVQQEGVLNTTVVITGHASDAIARRPAPSVRPDEASAAALAPPPDAPYDDSAHPSFGGSTDERYAPLTVYRQPPTPPPAYPPFPRPGFPFGDGR